MKKCPYCAEEIQDEAKKCKHCGGYLEIKEKQLTSQPSGKNNYWISYLFSFT